MPDPFGEAPEPLWRRVWRRRREQGAAPKRWATAAGAIGPAVLFLVPAGHHMELIEKLAISFAILALPPALVELWWKQRRRRASEELLIGPD